MINLIPNEEKKKIIADFYFRFFSVFFIMLALGFCILAVLLFPSYFLSVIENRSVNARLVSQANEAIPLPDKNTLSAVDDLNKKISIAEDFEKQNQSLIGKVMDPVLSSKIKDIKITSLSYMKLPEKPGQMTVSGVATNREALVLFRQNLEKNVAFSSVDLPISNFVKGSNIRFSLELTFS